MAVNPATQAGWLHAKDVGRHPDNVQNVQGVLNWTASAVKLAPRPLPVIRDAGEYSCVLRPFLGLLIHSMGHLLAA